MAESPAARNPLKSFMDLKREEIPLVLSMFGYFFLVITTFWILKPLKKVLFVKHFEASPLVLGSWTLGGAQAEQLAKVLNMVVAFLAVILFTTLARKMRRQQLTLVFCAILAAGFLFFAISGGHPTDTKAWTFYLFGDLWNTVMVATFFAFLNDSFSPEAAKRAYGPIVLGGVVGGAFGSLFVQQKVDSFGFATWMFICLGATGLIALLAVFAGSRVKQRPPTAKPHSDVEPAAKQGNAALEGARLVFRSPYLLSIVAIMATYEIVSTIMDFQFTTTLINNLSDESLDNAFANTYLVSNSLALFVQLFLTTFILTRFRHTVALLTLPVLVLVTSTGFLFAPIVLMAAALSAVDNGFNYSLNQSAREALYTPTTRDEKYKAKAFIDMFVMRFAKALAVGLNLGISIAFASGASTRYLSILTIILVLGWIMAARYAGRHFEQVTAEAPR